jgi:hypothetical protein
MKRIIISAVLVACLLGMQSCITCQPDWDRPTCDVRQAEAIAGQVDVGLQALVVAVPTLPAPALAAIAAYHAALPLAVKALDAALQEYELTHSGAWKAALAFLVNLYESIDNLLTGWGQASVLAQAKATVKAQGVSQTLQNLKLQGVLK